MRLFIRILIVMLSVAVHTGWAQFVPPVGAPTGTPAGTPIPTQPPSSSNPPNSGTTTTNTTNTNNTDKVDNPPGDDNTAKTDEFESEMDRQKFREGNQDYIDGLPIFGNSVFKSRVSSFAPNTNIPTPENYTVGPGDQLRIDVTGLSLKTWDFVTVQPDGSIFLDQIGRIVVGGQSLDDAKQLIINRLIANNVAIGRGSEATITLTNIRTIKISIIGEVENQGDFSVSSLTTLFNALYLAGGIKRNGSFRAIEVIRNNEVIRRVDVYKYLLYGDLSENIQLRDGDLIKVPLYNIRVGIMGEVKRPAFFEVVSGETLSDVIKFAGGFTEFAYPNVIEAIQLTDREKRIRTIEIKDKDFYYPQNGDRYTVQKILDRYENRVTIEGAVYRPGMFELESVPTLKALIKKADGLKEDAFLDRAYITRQNPKDFSSELLTIDIRNILNGTVPDIVLQREDVVRIKSIYDISDQSTVTINGHVRDAKIVGYYPGMTVEDLILLVGGFQDGADYSVVQIARRVKDSDRKSKDAILANIFNVSIDPYLRVTENKTVLEPYDVVTVFKSTTLGKNITVKVEGQVMRPGHYTLISKGDRISDLIARAGGFTELAYLKGATFKRLSTVNSTNEKELAQQRKTNRIQRNVILDHNEDGTVNSSKSVLDQQVEPQFVNIDLVEVMKKPKSSIDLFLREGDVINIPELMQTVRIVGEVNQPSIAVYVPGKSMQSYIRDNAGGYNDLAHRRYTYISYPNGATLGRGTFGAYPKVEPGSEIVVPFKEPKAKKSFDVQTFMAVTSSLASMTALVMAIIRLNEK